MINRGRHPSRIGRRTEEPCSAAPTRKGNPVSLWLDIISRRRHLPRSSRSSRRGAPLRRAPRVELVPQRSRSSRPLRPPIATSPGAARRRRSADRHDRSARLRDRGWLSGRAAGSGPRHRRERDRGWSTGRPKRALSAPPDPSVARARQTVARRASLNTSVPGSRAPVERPMTDPVGFSVGDRTVVGATGIEPVTPTMSR